MSELKEETNNGIYPSLVNPDPSAPVAIIEMTDSGQSFRLNKISEVQKFLEEEIRIRGELSKKYMKYSKYVDNVESGLTVVAMGAGAGGLALLSTVVAIPATIGLEVAALVVGLGAVTSKFFTRRARTKSEKHADIKNIALAKLDTVNTHISKAINDNKVTHEEFNLIMEELSKYKELKEEIRSKTNKKKEGRRREQFDREGEERSPGRIQETGREKPRRRSPLLSFSMPKFNFSCSCVLSNME